MDKPRIYADFNNADAQGRVRLHCQGTVDDLQRLEIALVEGQRIMLYDDELEAEGIVAFNAAETIWVAEVNWAELLKGARCLTVNGRRSNGTAYDEVLTPPSQINHS